MSRRKILLLASVLCAVAISLGFVAPDYLPSQAPTLMAEARACLETRPDEPDGEPADADGEQEIATQWIVVRFNLGRTRRPLFTDIAKGVVKNTDWLESPLDRLDKDGALKADELPKVTTYSGHSYVISSTANVVSGATTVVGSSSTLRKDGRIQVKMKILFVKPQDHLVITSTPFRNLVDHDFATAGPAAIQMNGSVAVKDGQMCFLGGVRRKNIDTDDFALPGLGEWLTLPRAVEIYEEVLILATPTLLPRSEWEPIVFNAPSPR